MDDKITKFVSGCTEEECKLLYRLLRKKLNKEVTHLLNRYDYVIYGLYCGPIFQQNKSLDKVYRHIRHESELFDLDLVTALPQILYVGNYKEPDKARFDCAVDQLDKWEDYEDRKHNFTYIELPDARKLYQALVNKFGPDNRYIKGSIAIKLVSLDPEDGNFSIEEPDVFEFAHAIGSAKVWDYINHDCFLQKVTFKVEIDGQKKKVLFIEYEVQ